MAHNESKIVLAKNDHKKFLAQINQKILLALGRQPKKIFGLKITQQIFIGLKYPQKLFYQTDPKNCFVPKWPKFFSAAKWFKNFLHPKWPKYFYRLKMTQKLFFAQIDAKNLFWVKITQKIFLVRNDFKILRVTISKNNFSGSF